MSFALIYSIYVFTVDFFTGVFVYLLFLWIWLTILSYQAKFINVKTSVNIKSVRIIRVSSIISFIIIFITFISLFSFGGRLIVKAIGLYFFASIVIPILAILSLLIYTVELNQKVSLRYLNNNSLNKTMSLLFLPYGIWLIELKEHVQV